VNLCRQNEELEQATLAIQEEKERLEKEAQSLAQQLQAVLNDKFVPHQDFDADTPIDKTLKMMQTIIGVRTFVADVMLIHSSVSLHPAVLLHTYQCQIAHRVCEFLCLDDDAVITYSPAAAATCDMLVASLPSCVRICCTPQQLPNDC